MVAVNQLKREHELLRTKLGMLEAAQRMEAWLTVREMALAFGRLMAEHARAEEELFTRCRPMFQEAGATQQVVDHGAERRQWEAVNRFFAEQPCCLYERTQPLLAACIANIRQGVAQQETELFPTMELVLVLQQLARWYGPPETVDLAPAQTVHGVLQRFPETGAIFRGLRIFQDFVGEFSIIAV